jgi:hypothetical protein
LKPLDEPSANLDRKELRKAGAVEDGKRVRMDAAVLKAGSSNPDRLVRFDGRLPRLEASGRFWSRADRLDAVYLRAAQAYMLISMPTGTSTIFGAFQAIRFSQISGAMSRRSKG